jgi:DNA-binding transcriptional LysR family regulator
MPAASDEAIAKFAAADLGVGLLSRFVAQRYVEAGALGYVRIPGWKCPRRFYMLRRRDVPNPLADAFWTLAATHASRPTGSPVDSAERQAHALPHGRGAASG